MAAVAAVRDLTGDILSLLKGKVACEEPRSFVLFLRTFYFNVKAFSFF